MRMPEATRPADAVAREMIVSEVSRSVSVEASAGTGKTFLMTDRVMRLARHFGGIDRMAVLTFGEAAAAELRRRIRSRIAAMPDEGGDGELKRRLSGQIPGAYVTTIHSFASSMLREYPHLTDTDPSFEVSACAIPAADLSRLWEEHLLEDPARLAGCADLVAACGSGLPGIAMTLASRPWAGDAASLSSDGAGARAAASSALARLKALAGEADPTDAMASKIACFIELAGPVLDGRATPGMIDRAVGAVNLQGGRKASWPDGTLAEAKSLFGRFKVILRSLPLAEQFERLVPPFTERLRSIRASDRSNLSFDEILSRLCGALERSDDLRRAISSRFVHFLVDEYQDTSSEQIAIFRSILAGSGGYGRGSITVVGDPKQSIYAWRQADLELYAEERRSFEADTAGTLSERITVSFRSSRAIVSLVNAAGPLIFGGTSPFDCGYSDFEPRPDAPEGPRPVVVLLDDAATGDDPGPTPGELVDMAAGWCARSLACGPGGEPARGGAAILMTAGTHAGILLARLSEAGIPYSATVGRTFKARPETVDLREMLSCLSFPGDERALIHTLRSPFFGVEDGEITRAVAAGLAEWPSLPEGFAGRAPQAARACEMLSRLRSASARMPVGDFLHLLLCETEIAPVLAASGWEPDRRLSNLGFLIEQAAGGAFASLADLREALAEGPGEGILEEPSPVTAAGTVSVTTIHKSKGLTFDCVMLIPPFGKHASRRSRGPVILHEKARRAAVSFGADLGTPLLDELREREAQQDAAEARRLVYVALTRASTGLVIFVRRSAWEDPPHAPEGFDGILANALRGAWEADNGLLDVSVASGTGSLVHRAVRRIDPARVPSERPLPVLSAVVPEEAAPDASTGSPAIRLGLTVHRILEKIDLAEPEEWLDARSPLRDTSGADPARVIELVRNLFAMKLPFDIRKTARALREYPYITRDRQGCLRSYVDILAEQGGRLFALDYKTDSVTEAEVPSTASGYIARQAGYGQDLADALGREVSVWLAFLSPGVALHVGDFRPSPR